MAVELVKSGGVAGIMETWEMSAQASPPSGMSPADARKVLAIASSDEFRSMTSEAVPSDYCCDQFHYEVTVTYADGSTAHHETADGLDQPAPLRALISAFGRASAGRGCRALVRCVR